MNWTSLAPQNSELLRLRTTIKPIRDSFLAHTLDITGVQQPIINDIRRMIDLTLDLATDMSFLFLGNAVDTDRFREFCREGAARFWDYAFRSPIQVFQADMNRRREAGLQE